ncbi:MAG: peptidase S41, partial [Bacteroidales bacterium]|nr:peptidase S41 [Bacteroidales bacterium]
KTKNGRTVFDGEGIEPDIEIELDKLSNISYSLFTKFLFFDYATRFARENSEIAPADEFRISDDIYNDFVAYISDKDYEYTTKCEETLDKLKKYAEDEKYFESIKTEFETLSQKVKDNKQNDIEMHKDEIKRVLLFEIISRYYYQKGKIISSFSDDKDIAKAIEIIEEQDSYLAILDGKISSDKENQ